MSSLSTFDRGAAEVLLTKMSTARSFSICDLDKLGKLLGVNPSRGHGYKALSALHCVEYSEMPKHVRDNVMPEVVNCLRGSAPRLNGELLMRSILSEGNDFSNVEDFPLKIGRSK